MFGFTAQTVSDRAEENTGLAVGHARDGADIAQHPVELLQIFGENDRYQIPGAIGRVNAGQFRNATQPSDDLRRALTVYLYQSDGGDAVLIKFFAHANGETKQGAGFQQPVYSVLNGTPRDAQNFGDLRDRRATILAQDRYEFAIQVIIIAQRVFLTVFRHS